MVAVPSVKLGVTVSPPCTAWFKVTVKVRASPSTALTFAIVTVALPPVRPPSSSVMVPVAGSPAVTPEGAFDTLRLTAKVSSSSTTASSMVATVKVCSSPTVPVKLSAAVLAV